MSLKPELPWTGERLVPSHFGDTAIEHLHRYAFAREYIWGKNVLDIACGEGYGTHLLSTVAASVVGIDISAEVIDHARSRYGDKVTFSVGSCTSIPLPDASMDAVVSFETLEHVAEHEEMLAEVKRVLRPGGILILSTPDKMTYAVRPEDKNPFHVRELSTQEFRDLLNKFFAFSYFLEQRICHGSVLAPAAGKPISGVRHYLGNFDRLDQTNGILAPVYNIAVATDDETELPVTVSLFQGRDIPTDLEKHLVDEQAAHKKQLADLEKQLADTQVADAAAIARLETHLANVEAAHVAARDEINVLRQRLQQVHHRVVEAAARFVRQLIGGASFHESPPRK